MPLIFDDILKLMKCVVLPKSVGAWGCKFAPKVWCKLQESMCHEQMADLNKGGGMEIFQSYNY